MDSAQMRICPECGDTVGGMNAKPHDPRCSKAAKRKITLRFEDFANVVVVNENGTERRVRDGGKTAAALWEIAKRLEIPSMLRVTLEEDLE